MKKLIAFTALIIFTFATISTKAAIQASFPQAIATCENYSKQGSVEHENEIFNILITLEKKGNKCIYKEKIYQDNKYQMLTCNFEQSQLNYLSASMQRFNDMFKKQISKNNIFEAKMTTNGEIFQKYLIDPTYCKITHSKK